MADAIYALHNFWSSFDWKAYDAVTVPSEENNPEIPRITYESAMDSFDSPILLSASLWDRTYGWLSTETKAKEIYDYIGDGGVLLPFDGGALWVKRASPFSQRMADEDDAMRRIVLQIECEFMRT